VANRIKELDGAAITPDSGKPVEAARPGAAVNTATTGQGSPGPAADSVFITQSARTLAALSQALQDTPDVDSGRVATLQHSIDAGLYQVDPDRIAGLMMQLEQDLNGTQAQ
jgi:flagellar biosynthesis anti-sigma factor FlgM